MCRVCGCKDQIQYNTWNEAERVWIVKMYCAKCKRLLHTYKVKSL